MKTTIETKPAQPIQNGHCMTVMSNDDQLSACKGCGQKRVIFQSHYFAFPGDTVFARCKTCHEAAAKERGGEIFVKTHMRRSLPVIWENDRLVEATPEKQEHLQKGREVKQQRRK